MSDAILKILEGAAPAPAHGDTVVEKASEPSPPPGKTKRALAWVMQHPRAVAAGAVVSGLAINFATGLGPPENHAGRASADDLNKSATALELRVKKASNAQEARARRDEAKALNQQSMSELAVDEAALGKAESEAARHLPLTWLVSRSAAQRARLEVQARRHEVAGDKDVATRLAELEDAAGEHLANLEAAEARAAADAAAEAERQASEAQKAQLAQAIEAVAARAAKALRLPFVFKEMIVQHFLASASLVSGEAVVADLQPRIGAAVENEIDAALLTAVAAATHASSAELVAAYRQVHADSRRAGVAALIAGAAFLSRTTKHPQSLSQVIHLYDEVAKTGVAATSAGVATIALVLGDKPVKEGLERLVTLTRFDVKDGEAGRIATLCTWALMPGVTIEDLRAREGDAAGAKDAPPSFVMALEQMAGGPTGRVSALMGKGAGRMVTSAALMSDQEPARATAMVLLAWNYFALDNPAAAPQAPDPLAKMSPAMARLFRQEAGLGDAQRANEIIDLLERRMVALDENELIYLLEHIPPTASSTKYPGGLATALYKNMKALGDDWQVAPVTQDVLIVFGALRMAACRSDDGARDRVAALIDKILDASSEFHGTKDQYDADVRVAIRKLVRELPATVAAARARNTSAAAEEAAQLAAKQAEARAAAARAAAAEQAAAIAAAKKPPAE